MKIDLSGKTAVVTGSTEGIGYGIARGLAMASARVVLNGRKQGTVDAAVARLRGDVKDAQVLGVAVDLGTAKGCSALFQAAPAADILVNNVGIFGLRDFFETPDEIWEQ